MDRELLKACSVGDLNLLRDLVNTDPNIMLSKTPQENNCLHIAAILGHNEFAKEVWSRTPSFLFGTNVNGEIPLILALMAANVSLASDMITAASQHQEHYFKEMLMKIGRNGDNALHHAIRNGMPDLALKLLNIEPRLSEQDNNIQESPMFMAARKRYSQLVEKMLQIPNSSAKGPNGTSAFDIAVDNHNPGIVKLLLERRPELAIHRGQSGNTVLRSAVYAEDFEVVKLLLEHDPNLAYIKDDDGETPFHTAAKKGFVQIAKEIFRACPDSAYVFNNDGQNALHLAILEEHQDFVDYVLKTPKLHFLMNANDIDGEIPLHYAARQCNPELLRLLLSNKRHDYTAYNQNYLNAFDVACERTDLIKTIKWNESTTLLINALPIGWKDY